MGPKCAIPTCIKRLTFIEKTTYFCSKCEVSYCTLHRLAEAHCCKHNYKADVNKEQFINENKCVKEKIIKL
jgi:hypothetical protein